MNSHYLLIVNEIMMISDGVDSLISISTIWKEKNKRDNGFNK
jgi:hypothetical protein